MTTTLFTIGYAQSTAEHFFSRLEQAGVTHVADVRRQNTSQLAGFTKVRDLPWLLEQLLGAGYSHRLDLAPTAADLKAYRAGELSWDTYAKSYRTMLDELTDDAMSADSLPDATALLCSEPTAELCHRRLLAEHLATQRGKVEVVHL